MKKAIDITMEIVNSVNDKGYADSSLILEKLQGWYHEIGEHERKKVSEYRDKIHKESGCNCYSIKSTK